MTGIYKITNQITNDFYIGQSKHIEKRFKEHFCIGYGAKHSPLFQKHINEYGIGCFILEVVEECAETMLIEQEKKYIALMKPTYNVVFDGHSVSKETRDKISVSLSGKKQSEATKQKRKNSLKALYKVQPRTNDKHKKKVCYGSADNMFESVKALSEKIEVHPSSVTKALKRNGKVKGHKVWYAV